MQLTVDIQLDDDSGALFFGDECKAEQEGHFRMVRQLHQAEETARLLDQLEMKRLATGQGKAVGLINRMLASASAKILRGEFPVHMTIDANVRVRISLESLPSGEDY